MAANGTDETNEANSACHTISLALLVVGHDAPLEGPRGPVVTARTGRPRVMLINAMCGFGFLDPDFFPPLAFCFFSACFFPLNISAGAAARVHHACITQGGHATLSRRGAAGRSPFLNRRRKVVFACSGGDGPAVPGGGLACSSDRAAVRWRCSAPRQSFALAKVDCDATQRDATRL